MMAQVKVDFELQSLELSVPLGTPLSLTYTMIYKTKQLMM